MAFIDDTKPWFETGDFPTQEQFYTFFARIRWKDEPLTIDEITNLTTIINQLANPLQAFVTDVADFEIVVPAGFLLEKIILQPVVGCNPYLEHSGGEPIIPESEGDYVDDTGHVWNVDVLAIEARTIVIKGLPIGSTVKTIRRKITL